VQWLGFDIEFNVEFGQFRNNHRTLAAAEKGFIDRCRVLIMVD